MHPWRALRQGLRRIDEATEPLDPAIDEAFRHRWDDLPERVRTDAQMIGRRSPGCEGTQGVFPKCNFSCSPCYHSADANKVRVDGPHTVARVTEQMAYLRAHRSPVAFAQLIGGEVSLLEPHDHVAALEAMWAAGRTPMSFSHGDFTEDYLRSVTLRADGTPRFPSVSWSLHIDTTMTGRRDVPKPGCERELDTARAEAIARFRRLRREHRVRAYVAHTMTVTPANVDQVAEVIRTHARDGWRMFSFQPAAYVGNRSRWDDGYRTITDDEVWREIERGVGRRLPWSVMTFGDTRCNRAVWGSFVGERYVPVFEDDPADLAARDCYYQVTRGSWMHEPKVRVVAKLTRAVARHPRAVPIAVGWARRFVRRAGGLRALRRGVHPVTFAMHSFIDAADVGPAWSHITAGTRATSPRILAAQERLEACAYTMAHPETDRLVPACVQHAVLDPDQNRQLVELLPLRSRPSPATASASRSEESSHVSA